MRVSDAAIRKSDEATVLLPWSIWRLIRYQLAPGAVSFVVFVTLAWLLRDSWIPLMAVLFFAILLGEAPVSWYLMVRANKAEGGRISFASLFPWHQTVGTGRMAGLGFGLAAVGIIIVFGLASLGEPIIQGALFEWVPEWVLLRSGPQALSDVTKSGLLLLWCLAGMVGIVIGGSTQELYHRGFLLPRASHLGWISVPMNGALFAVAHFVAPWGWPFFFLAATAWGYAVYRWRSIQLGILGHLGMLTLGWLMMTGIVFGFIPAP